MSVLTEILDIEYEMFMNVNAEGDPECRKHAEDFRLHREVQFSAWSEDTIESYLNDLREAEKTGKNLMTYKYARMDNLVPPENNNPLIGKIADIQIEWQREIVKKYPKLMKNARGVVDSDDSPLAVSFSTYLSAELESYSDVTLELLYRDVKKYKENNINMSEKIYENLVARTGHGSIESFENS